MADYGVLSPAVVAEDLLGVDMRGWGAMTCINLTTGNQLRTLVPQYRGDSYSYRRMSTGRHNYALQDGTSD